MGRIATGCTVVAAVVLFAATAQATTIQELKASLGNARQKVVAMVNSSDKPEQEKLQQDVKTATQEVDAVLAAGQGTGDGRAGGAVQEDDWPARVALGLRSGPG